MLGALFLCTSAAYATSSTMVIDLGDSTTEYAQIGYGSNPNLESLEYWFSQNGITNPDGSAVNPITDQSQAELFYTSETKEYEVEFLGIGYARYHSPFGVFTYDGNPYESFDSSKLTFYDPLFVQNEVAINSTYKFTVSAGTYFGFYLNSNGSGTMLTTMVAANPAISSSSKVVNKSEYTNGFDNAIFFATNKGYTIAFEDIIGGGDADWEDLVVNFRPTDGSDFESSSTPEPQTLLLLGLGMIGVASLRRRYGKNNSLKKYAFLFILGAMFLHSQAIASQVVIKYVPAYSWYNGCGPTASAMIMGYWDIHGYDALFNASGWDEVRLTENVKEEISSSAHNEKYNSTPDNPNLPDPPDTSLADFFHTSEGILSYGNSYLSYADDVFIDYAAYRGYQFDAFSEYFSSFSWAEFVAEIDAGRPMMLAVDTNQDARMNHVVTAIGYEDRGADGWWYASYSTWSESESDILWQPFRGLSSNWNWGIGYATFVKPISIASAYTLPGDTPVTPPDPVIVPEPDITPDEITPDTLTATPEPASMILLAVGLAAFACIRKQIHA